MEQLLDMLHVGGLLLGGGFGFSLLREYGKDWPIRRMPHHHQAHQHRPALILSRRATSVLLPLATMIIDPPTCLTPPLSGFDKGDRKKR